MSTILCTTHTYLSVGGNGTSWHAIGSLAHFIEDCISQFLDLDVFIVAITINNHSRQYLQHLCQW